jgi:hypothetical protein
MVDVGRLVAARLAKEMIAVENSLPDLSPSVAVPSLR